VLRPDLPEWRQPFGVVTNGAAQRERMSLREAVLDLLGEAVHGAVLSRKRIAEVIHEEWGDCSDNLLDSVLVELVDDGELRQLRGDRYTRGGEA
jgi:hypothetical protein